MEDKIKLTEERNKRVSDGVERYLKIPGTVACMDFDFVFKRNLKY